jgi:hypothetical protein
MGRQVPETKPRPITRRRWQLWVRTIWDEADTPSQQNIGFLLDLAGIIKFSCTAQRGDVVVLQYPIKKYFAFICDMARLHGARP